MEPKTFVELGLSPNVLSAIESAGYTSPTPIQEAAIPVAVTGRDVLGIAQTGTGKTASFTLPMITRLEKGRARARMPRSLILAPTRELAAQVAESFERYGVNNKLTLALLIGGVSFEDQFKKLDRGVDVLIATPGRLLDHFQRGKLMLMGVEILVIDEADRMLDMGFIPDIEKICKLLPPRRQTLFFSATMPKEITRLANAFLKDPERVEVAPPASTAKTIQQTFRFCPQSEDWAKREDLRSLIREAGEKLSNAIIFANRKRDVSILLKSLTKHGFNAGALHGDMDQKTRMETLAKFRDGEIKFLAASDVAARGLDIPDVSHVFNFDMPWQSDDYVHRIGRTGRAGREGHSLSLVTADDLKVLKEIEKLNGEDIVWDGEAPDEEAFDESTRRKRRGRNRSGRPNSTRRGKSQATPNTRRSRASSSEFSGSEADETPRKKDGKEEGRKPRRRSSSKDGSLRKSSSEETCTEKEGMGDDGLGLVDAPLDAQPENATTTTDRPRGRRRKKSSDTNSASRSKTTSSGAKKPDEDRHVSDNEELNSTQRSTGERRASGRTKNEKRENARKGDQNKVLGFADNVPEFLRRPVPRKKASAR